MELGVMTFKMFSGFVGLIVLLVMCVPALSAPSVSPVGKVLRFYNDVGRIQWELPPGENFYFAVPDWTVGPRLKCKNMKSTECEIQVSARALTTTVEQRRAELLDSMSPYYADAVEKSRTIQSYGGSDRVQYVVLTDRRDGGKVANGFYVKGPFAIKFNFLTNDVSGNHLDTVLKLINSATAQDGEAYLSFKLADHNAACDKLFPEFSAQNSKAFSASRFSGIDYVKLLTDGYPPEMQKDVPSQLHATRLATIKDMGTWPQEDAKEFCRSLPMQIGQAEH